MRFGTRRGVAPLLAIALTTALATGMVATATVRAGVICHAIPREVVAVDVNTGGQYLAPPVPYGCYAKDCLGTICEGVGMVRGCLGSVCGLLHGCCPGCHGDGCGQCGGTGKCGHCGLCRGPGLLGHGHGGDPCAVCGGVGKGCGFCQGMGLLHGRGCGSGASGAPCGGGLCSPQIQVQAQTQVGGASPVKKCSYVGKASTVCPSTQVPIVSAQEVCPSAQMSCTQPGCKLRMRHFHRMGKGCNACGGMGCGICQGGGSGCGLLSGKLCGGCGGGGCGLCGGLGLLHKGDPCSGCGGRGCKLCCGNLLGLPAGLLAKVFHIGDIKYFVGPGGPVPITPGYVPYVVTTRSPRDYFAFPPFSDLDP